MKRVVMLLVVVSVLAASGSAAAQAKPEGEIRYALYVTLAPAWFDPAEVVGVLTPFWVLYAMHDALVKPMPGNHQAPSLAESWTVSPDQRVEQGRAVPVPAPTEPTVDDLLDRYLVIGTPDTCVRQIKRIQEAVGITHFNCSFWFGDLEHARVLRSMETFAREVMPAFA